MSACFSPVRGLETCTCFNVKLVDEVEDVAERPVPGLDGCVYTLEEAHIEEHTAPSMQNAFAF